MTHRFIRDLDPTPHARLTARGAAHHRSPEAEARLLPQASLAAPTPPHRRRISSAWRGDETAPLRWIISLRKANKGETDAYRAAFPQ